jgi:triosephosphate isomerase
MARRPIMAANWKMHKTHLEAIRDVQKLSYLLNKDDVERVEVVVCPPFTALRAIQILIESDRLRFGLGAQNVHFEEKGAFTGEVSPPMLQALKVRYVIVGHSERRELFGETDVMVNNKVRAVFAHDMTPILCVGETLQERDLGNTEEKVEGQVRAALDGVASEEAAKLVVAYEPIWAIGTGRTATPQQAEEVHAMLRALLSDAYGPEVSGRTVIQYGGSVKPENAGELMSMPNVDGALVGGASLKADAFTGIVRAARGVKK